MPSWPTTRSGDVLSGKGAKTVGQDCWDMAVIGNDGATLIYFGDVTETGAFPQTKATVTVRLPESVRSGDKLKLSAYCSCSGGGTGSFRWSESGTPVNGTTETFTTGSWETSEITVPDNTWAGATKTFIIESGATAGTATVRSDQTLNNFRIETA